MHRLAIAFWLAQPLAAPVAGQELRIYHIDVEQAAATLFVAPGGKALLVDSGKNGHGSRIKTVMDEAGLTQIDFFVCTHYHEDHFGGIDDLVGLGVTVSKAFDRGGKEAFSNEEKAKATFAGYLTAVGNSAQQMTPGDTIALDASMTAKCIASGRRVIGDLGATADKDDENDNSVALLIEFGEFAYFVGGDIEEHTESAIADRDLVLDVDVYQANHHGSDTSSSEPFMKDLTPSVVVISNGNRADYRHPRQSTLDLLASLTPPPTVFQTNKYFKGGNGGNVADEFIADLETTDEDGTILITVNAAATQYVVSYRGKSKAFPVKGPGPVGGVVIASLLPDPVGSDSQLEVVSLRNDGPTSVVLSNWTLRDADDHFVNLTIHGSIPPGATLNIVRNGSRLSLDNDGDTIRLLDDDGMAVDEVSYGAVAKGEVVQGH